MLPSSTLNDVRQEKIEYVDKEGKKHTETTTTVNPSKSGAVAGAAAGAAFAGPAGAVVGGLIGLIFGPED